MKKSLLVIVLIVLSATISYSQVVDSTFEEDEEILGGRDYTRVTFSVDYLGQSSNSMRGGRFNYELIDDYITKGRSLQNIELSGFSIAVHRDYHKTLKVSSNPAATLLAVAALALIPRDSVKMYSPKNIVTGIFFLPLIVQGLTNPSFRINIINKNLYIVIGINTDYFFFYDVSRIYSEAFIGLRGRLKDFALSANLGIPFTKGYFENKAPYLGASALYYFDL